MQRKGPKGREQILPARGRGLCDHSHQGNEWTDELEIRSKGGGALAVCLVE